jgi:hypothetical protein
MIRRGAVMVGLLVAIGGCNRDPQGAPTGVAPGLARGDAPGGPPMDAARPTLRSLFHLADVPARVVAFDAAGEVVAADDRALVRAGGGAVASRVALDGWPGTVDVHLGDDGVALAGTARASAGALMGDVAAVRRALGTGYRATAAAWTPDGGELWLSAEKVIPRAPKGRAVTIPDGPDARFVVLDALLAVRRDVAWSPPVPWNLIATSPSWVAVSGGRVVALSRSGPDVVPLLPGPATALAFAPGHGYLAAMALDGVHVWRVDDWKEQARWDPRPTVPSLAIAVAPDGATVATAADGKVVLWRLVAGGMAEPIAEAPVTGMVTGLAYARDGARLAAASPAERRVEVFAIAAP